MPMAAEQMIRYLKQDGFQEVSGGGGSYRKFYNPGIRKAIVILYHCKDLEKGMEQTILEQAGLEKQPWPTPVILISYIKGGI